MLSVESSTQAVPKVARPINEMKCPFRVNENGEFMTCCGDSCMAYYEYEHTPFTFGCSMNSIAPTPVIVRVCRRLPPASTPYGYAV